MKNTMNIKSKINSVLLALVLLVTSVSCNNILNPKTEGTNGKAIINITLAEPRTAFPKTTLDRLSNFNLYYRDSYDNLNSVLNETSSNLKDFCRQQIELEPGEYTFVLRAYAVTTLFEAEKTVILEEGNNNLSFELKRMNYGDANEDFIYGDMSLTLIIPREFNISTTCNGSATIYNPETNLPAVSIGSNELSQCIADTTAEDLAGTEYSVEDFPKKLHIDDYWDIGKWNVKFELYNSDYTKVYRLKEYFYLASGCVTEKTFIITKAIDVRPVNFELNGGAFENGMTTYYCLENETLDLSTLVPVKTGSIFLGWYLDENFNMPAPDSVVADSTINSKLFHAKWYDTYVINQLVTVQPGESVLLEFTAEPGYMYEIRACDKWARFNEYNSNNKVDARFIVEYGEQEIGSHDDLLFYIVNEQAETVKITTQSWNSEDSGDAYIRVTKNQLSETANITQSSDGFFNLTLPLDQYFIGYSVKVNDSPIIENIQFTDSEISEGVGNIAVPNPLEIDTPFIITVNISGVNGTKFYFYGTTQYDRASFIKFDYQYNNMQNYLPYTSGSIVNVVEVEDGIFINHVFDGWYETPECDGEEITSVDTSAISEDYTLYAKWTSTYHYDSIMYVNGSQNTERTFNVETGHKYKIGFCDTYHNGEYFIASNKTDAKFSLYIGDCALVSSIDDGEYYFVAAMDTTMKVLAQPYSGYSTGNCYVYVIDQGTVEHMLLTENSDSTFTLTFPLDTEDNYYSVYQKSLRIEYGWAEDFEMEAGYYTIESIPSKISQNSGYYFKIQTGNNDSYYLVGIAQYEGTPDYTAVENADGTFAFTVNTIPENTYSIKLNFSINNSSNTCCMSNIEVPVSEFSENVMTVNSPFNINDNYSISMTACDVGGISLYSYETFTGTALYESKYRQWNADGTLTFRTKVGSDSNSLTITPQIKNQYNNYDSTWTGIIINLTDEDRENGYKDITIDSPFVENDMYRLYIYSDDYNYYYYTGVAKNNGKFATVVTENADGTLTLHLGIMSQADSVTIESRYRNYLSSLKSEVIEFTEEQKQNGYVEITRPSPFKADTECEVDFHYYTEESEYSILSKYYYFDSTVNGLAALYCIEKEDGTFDINMPVKENVNYFEIIYYKEEWGTLSGTIHVNVEDADRTAGYKYFNVGSRLEAEDTYRICIYQYSSDDVNLGGEYIYGTAEYLGILAEYAIEKSDGTFDINMLVEDDVSYLEIECYVSGRGYIFDKTRINIEDADRTAGHKFFNMGSKMEAGDVYSIEIRKNDSADERKGYTYFNGTAEYTGICAPYAMEKDDGTFDIKVPVDYGVDYYTVFYFVGDNCFEPRVQFEVTDAERAAGYKIFNAGSGLYANDNYTLYVHCYDSEGEEFYINGASFTGTAQYTGNMVPVLQQNENGTFTITVPVQEDSATYGYEIRRKLAESIGGYGSVTNVEEIAIPEEALTSRILTFEIDSEFYQNVEFSIQLWQRKESEEIVNYSFILYDTAQYDGVNPFFEPVE